MDIFKSFYDKNLFKYYYALMFMVMPVLFLLTSSLYFHIPSAFKLSGCSLFLAVVIYLFSHLCRVVRLAFLTLDHNVKFRQLFRLHFHTAAVSRMLPFKLGELNRIYILSSLFDKQQTAIMVVWMERLFDSLVIALFLLFLAFAYSGSVMSYLTIISILGFFVILSFIMFFVLPETLNSIRRVLIMRYNKPWILNVLKFVSSTEQFVKLAPLVLKRKIIILTLLSAIVWASEICALAVLISENNSWSKLTLAISSLPDRLTNEFYQHPSSLFSRSTLLTLVFLFFIGFICLYFDYKAHHRHRCLQRQANYYG